MDRLVLESTQQQMDHRIDREKREGWREGERYRGTERERLRKRGRGGERERSAEMRETEREWGNLRMLEYKQTALSESILAHLSDANRKQDYRGTYLLDANCAAVFCT